MPGDCGLIVLPGSFLDALPQGLKPTVILRVCGTSKLVPRYMACELRFVRSHPSPEERRRMGQQFARVECGLQEAIAGPSAPLRMTDYFLGELRVKEISGREAR